MTRWSHHDVRWLLNNGDRVPHRFCAERLNRSENAVRVMASRLHREQQRVEAAKKLRNVSRKTSGEVSP